jgi:hypothetical protein
MYCPTLAVAACDAWASVHGVPPLARNSVKRSCAVCERSLLTGERAIRFSPDGEEFVDVCPLCQELAADYGWVKEGSPTSPTVPSQRRRKRRGIASLFDPRRQPPDDPVVAEPILRRLSVPEQQMVEAADIFNSSDYRRTVGGIAKSLGVPRASIVPLSGVSGELIVTVAWDISWYQYRVSPESAQAVRLAERGHELNELDAGYQRWNARIEQDGRLVPEISPV